jgi:hypothetical protein
MLCDALSTSLSLSHALSHSDTHSRSHSLSSILVTCSRISPQRTPSRSKVFRKSFGVPFAKGYSTKLCKFLAVTIPFVMNVRVHRCYPSIPRHRWSSISSMRAFGFFSSSSSSSFPPDARTCLFFHLFFSSHPCFLSPLTLGIQRELFNSADLACPVCAEPGTSLDSLHANVELREKVSRFQAEKRREGQLGTLSSENTNDKGKQSTVLAPVFFFFFFVSE